MRLSPFLYTFRLGWREAWADKAGLVGLFTTFATLVVLWASIWKLVSPELIARLGLTHPQAIWYSAIVELITFVAPGYLFKDIEDDIQDGQVIVYFLQPVNYILLKLAGGLGQGMMRLTALCIPAAALAYVLTGMIPETPNMAIVLLLIILSIVLRTLIQALIGLSAGWTYTAKAINLVLQKFMFILGGLFLPLSNYPVWLQTVAWLTPFPLILYAPASTVKAVSFGDSLIFIAIQMLWIVILTFMLNRMNRAFEKRLLSRGDV